MAPPELRRRTVKRPRAVVTAQSAEEIVQDAFVDLMARWQRIS
jgi:hypothetical protein